MDNLPELPGVYAIRQTEGRPLSHLPTGFSDLVYIGSAANQRGLRQRIRHYYHPGPTQLTNNRVNQLVMNSDGFGLSYLVAPDRKAAKVREAALLNRFYHDHGQLPPENRQLPAMSLREVEENLAKLNDFEQPEWSTYYSSGVCSGCGRRGRVLLADGNDPFYRGVYVAICSCREYVCDDEYCDGLHLECDESD